MYLQYIYGGYPTSGYVHFGGLHTIIFRSTPNNTVLFLSRHGVSPSFGASLLCSYQVVLVPYRPEASHCVLGAAPAWAVRSATVALTRMRAKLI